MKSLTSRIAGAVAGASLFLSSATAVLAQWEEEFTYDTTAADDVAAGFGAIGLIGGCCGVMFILAFLAFHIWILVHVIQNAPDDQKTLWILIVLFVPFGSLVYFFTKKKEWSSPKPKVEASKSA